MSGPVTATDAPPATAEPGHAQPSCVEISDDREATVGRFRVRRALPRRERRTVGAWCFADHMGPADVDESSGLDIGPHPHIGLQTVTWLLAGEALHRDSLGSEQVIRPGQLNLMTAGHGVAHSEEATGAYAGTLHGIQLWVAQPEGTRHGPAAFEHHTELPRLDLAAGVATVLVGAVGDVRSGARCDSPLVGVDLDLRRGTSALPLQASYEHALLVLDGRLEVDGSSLVPGRLGYLGDGRDELAVRADGDTRAVLLGGVPFEEPVLMWWNFVARTREEIAAAADAWRSGGDRFPAFRSPLARIPAPTPPWPLRSA